MSPSTPHSTALAAPGHAPLDRLNAADPATAYALLLECCGSAGWARRIVAHRPYPDVDTLLAAADEASYDLSADDLAEALARETASHPLDGEPGPSTLAAHTALRAAQDAYEQQFGHAFLICLDGHPPEHRLDHALAGIRARLENEPHEEWAVTADELRRLARSRLARLTADAADAADPTGTTDSTGTVHAPAGHPAGAAGHAPAAVPAGRTCAAAYTPGARPPRGPAGPSVPD